MWRRDAVAHSAREHSMPEDACPKKPRYNIDATITQWRRDIRLLMTSHEKQIDRLERLDCELAELQRNHPPEIGLGSADEDPVAYFLDMRKNPDDSARVSIDGGEQIVLGPQLASVFVFLATGDSEDSSDDPLVGWRSKSAILGLLSRSGKRELKARYVNNLIHRLKETLTDAGYNRGLIQTCKRKGARLALKRR
jgi:hypothetical protein